MKRMMTAAAATMLGLLPTLALAQGGPDQPVAVQAAQTPASARRAAMARLDFMRGEWSGPASGVNPNGVRYAITQTERIGPMLDGDVLVIEGRGYNPDGATGFNAFAVVSWNVETNAYEMRAYAEGRGGTFPLTLTDDGYVWEVPAGPGVMRYTADVTETTYHEVGDFEMPGQPACRMFEMTLKRRGDTDWPAAGAVSPTP